MTAIGNISGYGLCCELSSGGWCIVSTASNNVGVERIKLSDGTALKLETLIVDVRESGFSTF